MRMPGYARIKRFACLTIVMAAVAACAGGDAVTRAIAEQFAQSGQRRIDLARAVPAAWKRVCMLGPYTDDAATEATLGFKWDSRRVSKVASDDTIVLLVFVGSGNDVVLSTNYLRGKGDFSNVSRQCFTRAQARFVQVDAPQRGWPGLFPEPAE